jgi:hypothetical protein
MLPINRTLPGSLINRDGGPHEVRAPGLKAAPDLGHLHKKPAQPAPKANGFDPSVSARVAQQEHRVAILNIPNLMDAPHRYVG